MNYPEFCKKVTEDDPSIFLTGVISVDKVLGLYARPGEWTPEEKDIPRFIAQIHITVSIPEANEKFFGPSRYVIVNYRDFETFLFPLTQKRVLVMLAKTPCDHNSIIRKGKENAQLLK